MSRTRRRTTPHAGFTLIELVIVMVIVGIVGAVVIPSLFRPPAISRTAAADPLVTILRAARYVAADSGRPVRLTIDPMRARYIVQLPDANRAVADGTIDMRGASLSADSIRVTFLFEPSGSALGDSLFVLGGPRPLVVRANPWTGEPEVRVQ